MRKTSSRLYSTLLRQAAEDVRAAGVCCAVLHGHHDDPPDSALALRFLGAVHRIVLQGKAPQRIVHTPWSHQRRICYKAEHAVAGSNLRFLVTNLSARSRSIFSFYNDRGECENRIEEFKNGFAADRLSCQRFRANAFRLLLHSFAYNMVNLFRLQLPSSVRSAQIETLRTQLFKIGARIRQTARCVRIHLASGWPFQDLFQAVSLCNSS